MLSFAAAEWSVPARPPPGFQPPITGSQSPVTSYQFPAKLLGSGFFAGEESGARAFYA